MAKTSNYENARNLGLLILRVGLGGMMIWHGYPKLIGGPEMWKGVGMAMGNLGITFLPAFWGFMAAAVEAIGGLLIIAGLLYRPVCILLVINLIVAAIFHFTKGDGLAGASHAIELAIAFLGMAFIGPGKYSVDKR